MYSEYYEKNFNIGEEEKEILLDIYEEIAEEQGFEPDYEDRDLVNFEDDPDLMDTILYHVDSFGKEKSGYEVIADLFKDKSEDCDEE